MLVIEIVPPAVGLSSIALTGRGHNLWMFEFRDILALVGHAESKCFRDTVVAEYVGFQ